MILPPSSQSGDFWVSFLSIFFEGIPFILLGSLVSGIIDAWLPANAMDRILPKRGLLALLMSGLLGLIFPVCECAIVPVIRRLVQKGLPVGCAMTYMLAAPIVNPITAFSTWAAFRPASGDPLLATVDPLLMTGARLMCGFAIAVLMGMVLSKAPITAILKASILQRMSSRPDTTAGPKTAHRHSHGIVHAFITAQRDFIDVLLYFIIGVAIAAIMQTQVYYRPGLQESINQMAGNHFLAAPILMVMAFVLSLCSTTDAFIIAPELIFTPAAKLAFLTFGPMLDLKLIFLYSTVLKPRVILFLAIGLFITVYACSLAMEPILNTPAL